MHKDQGPQKAFKCQSFSKILIIGTCERKNAIIFTDTGSTISLVSPSFIDRLNKFNEVLEDNTILTSFSNNKIRTKGCIYLNISIADADVSHKFIVSDLVQHDFLLGMDVMSKYSLNIDIEQRLIRSPFGETEFIRTPKSISKVHKISCKGTTVVQPNNMHTLKLRLQSKYNHGRVEGIFTPYHNFMADSGKIM